MISEQLVWIILGCMLAAYLLAITGIPVYLRRESLTGDALSHAIFPGVVVAVLISGDQQGWVTYLSGIIVGSFALFLIQTIHQKTLIPKDGATGIVLILFFAVGLLLMGRLQRSGIPLWGVQHVLLGKAATLLPSDVFALAVLSALGSVVFLLVQKWIWIEAFDSKFALHSGLPKNTYELLLSAWTALVLTATIQILGAVLSAAMLITPAALGHFLSNNPKKLTLITLVSACIAAVLAGFISASLPSMSTGALTVIMLFMLSFPFFIFHPTKGILMKWVARKQEARRWQDENTLKQLLNQTKIPLFSIKNPSLQRLAKHSFVRLNPQGKWELSPKGLEEAERIVRKHRLWETFLHKRLMLPVGSVHENAELMEHLLDDEAEERLALDLNHPSADPHQSPIPPRK
jgi:manganese/zinc/iron transport system permease protein